MVIAAGILEGDEVYKRNSSDGYGDNGDEGEDGRMEKLGVIVTLMI
jgi:hypothetical protein